MGELPEEVVVLQQRCGDERLEDALRRLGVHVTNKNLLFGEDMTPHVTITADVGRMAFTGPEVPVADALSREVDATVDEFLDVRSRFQDIYGGRTDA